MDSLPDLALHKIMSFLSFIPAVRLAVLSKKLYSIWRSLGKSEIKFDGDGEPNMRKFFESIRLIVKGLPYNFLEKLSIRANFNRVSCPPPELLFIIPIFPLREFELINTDLEAVDLLQSSFYNKEINVLKLDGFRFIRELRLDCGYKLQKLRLRRIIGIHTLKLERNTSLESLDIDCGKELKLVKLDATKLEHFDCVGPSSSMHECEVVICPNTRALKSLNLNNVNVSNSFFQEESTPIFQRVEQLFLKLNENMELKCIELDWPNLKRLELVGMPSLEKINLLSENLQSCVLDMTLSPTCHIHFHNYSGKFLKSLTLLHSEVVTGIWIEQNLSWFYLLENFRVKGCKNLKWVKFDHDKIKNLELLCCNLDKVNINTPSLESLEMACNNSIPSCKVICSKPLSVKLSVIFGIFQPIDHHDLDQLLTTFNMVKELTLDIKSNFFEHVDSNDEEFYSRSYCFESCWKHRSINIKLSNFDDARARAKGIEKIQQLVEFLKGNASKLENIANNCDEATT